jgi:hypothetical protein
LLVAERITPCREVAVPVVGEGIDRVCGGPVSSDRLFGFLSEKIIQFVVAEAVEM